MSMPGWRRRSWSMALWPPLAAYLPKVESVHSFTINNHHWSAISTSSESQTSSSCSDMRPVTPPGLRELTGWPLSSASLTFNLWSCEGSYYDSCDIVGNSQNFSISHPLQIPQDAGSPQGQRCHCMGIVGLNIMKLAFREISVCFRSSFIHGIYELIHLDVNL